MKTLKGANLAGTSTTRDRVKNDYYATPYETTEALLNTVDFKGNFLEPCVGGGHIADVIKRYYPSSEIFTLDLVDRDYPNTVVGDFTTYEFDRQFDSIITNPPFSIAQEFLEKGSITIDKEYNGDVAIDIYAKLKKEQERKHKQKKHNKDYR